MKKEDFEFSTNTTIYDPLKIPNQVVIETDHIYIKHKDLGLKIDVGAEQIEELDRIIINGVSFIREN